MDGEDGFNEEAWNEGRMEREEAVVLAAMKLVRYMGCNHIQIPVPSSNLVVKIAPKEEK